MNQSLILNEDYYLDQNGNMVFTEAYHLKRGTCCGSGCRHCPFKNLDPNIPQELNSQWSDDHFYFEEENENDD